MAVSNSTAHLLISFLSRALQDVQQHREESDIMDKFKLHNFTEDDSFRQYVHQYLGFGYINTVSLQNILDPPTVYIVGL